MSEFNCNCIKLNGCGLFLTRLQAKNLQKSVYDKGLEMVELLIRKRKSGKPEKKKETQPGEENAPVIKQKINHNIKDKEENEKIKRSWDTVFSNHPQRIETIPKATSTIYKLTYGASIITCTVHCNATLMIQGAHHVDNWTVENIKSIYLV